MEDGNGVQEGVSFLDVRNEFFDLFWRVCRAHLLEIMPFYLYIFLNHALFKGLGLNSHQGGVLMSFNGSLSLIYEVE